MRFVSIATWTSVEPVSAALRPCFEINSCLASFVRATVSFLSMSPQSPHAVQEHTYGRDCGRRERVAACMQVAVLDDYQGAVETLDCFATLREHAVTVYRDPVTDVAGLASRLAG